MKKSPGFWFFTGDWLKDPELRFCSIFARGLLVDLLCYMFEANEQGYLSKPDGTARSDLEIVDAISGGSREEKLAGLAELEQSGVFSRDSRGVLYSRRIARLGDISKVRQQNGSKGGSKTQANFKQTVKQTDKQKRGVSVSDSVSVSDTFNNTNTPLPPRGKEAGFDALKVSLPPEINSPEMQAAWLLWCKHRTEIKKPLKPTMVEQQLSQFVQWGQSRSIAAIRHTVARGWQGIQEPEVRRNGKIVNPEIGDLF